MVKTQVYLPEDELKAHHRVARREKRSVADLIREAIRATWIRPSGQARLPGPVGLWDGEVRISSREHDAIYDEP